MTGFHEQKSRLILIRHAPISDSGRLCGKTDLPVTLDPHAVAPVATFVRHVTDVVCSPALRCRQTAQALWPDLGPPVTDVRLWEQDFGDHDGLPFSQIPDIGVLDSAALAQHCPPNGESFDDLCARVRPAIQDAATLAFERNVEVALVVHAGVIRAALGLVLDNRPAGLGFEVANLSVTRLRVGPNGPVSVMDVNRTWPV